MDYDVPVVVKSRGKHGFFQVDNFIFNPKYDLSGYAILVYCLLCKVATKDSDEVHTTRAYLAKCARISKGSVSNATAELAGAGIISITERREGRKRLPSSYILNSPLRRSTSDLQEELGGSTYDGQPMTVIEPSVIHTLVEADPEKTTDPIPSPAFSLSGETAGKSPKKKKQKPDKPPVDPRHDKCVDFLAGYWDLKNPTLEGKVPFTSRTAGEIAKFLKTDRNITPEEFAECLQNRAESDGISPTEDPVFWIKWLSKYRAGSLDRYGKQKE